MVCFLPSGDSGRFMMFTLSTPPSQLASTLERSAASGKRSARLEKLLLRSTRCQVVPASFQSRSSSCFSDTLRGAMRELL